MAENVSVEKLTPKQQRAVSALMTGGTIKNAAQIAKISERQLFRWMEQPNFRQALSDASDTAVEAAARMLSDASAIAILTLREIATKKSASDNARVRASDVIIGHMLKVKELAEIERRLSELERTQNAKR